MKPLHAGLLIAGAALAGGLAVKMTEPQPLPVAMPKPVPVQAPLQQVASPAAAVQPILAKPSPFSTEVTPAPEEVFVESVQPANQPPIRKNEPILTAKTTTPQTQNPAVLFVPPVHYDAPAPPPAAQAVPEPAQVDAAPAPAARKVTLPAGMMVLVRLNQTVSSDRNVSGDRFDASLAEPLVVDGLVIAERGARVGGRVVDAQKSGTIALELASISTSDGQKIAISTDPWARRADALRGEDAAKIGGGAALGAILGAVAGGGKGAAIGAGVGGGLGVGAVAATHGKPANVSPETLIRFRLATRVTITERQL